MTEPAPTPRHYAPTEPDPEMGLIPAVRAIRRELLKHPAPVTAAAIEIERLRGALAQADDVMQRLLAEAALAAMEPEEDDPDSDELRVDPRC